jgi:hypothetical protein
MSRRPRRTPRPQPTISVKPALETAVATSAVAAGLALLVAPSADAATFQVTNLNDSGAGSLRQAIVDADNTAGNDVVTFQAGLTGTITLTSGQLYISDGIDVQGPGANLITVSGNGTSRVFYIYSPDATIDVTLSGLTIANGVAEVGGGVVNFDENVTLDHDVVTNNTASHGGGVATGGTSGTLQIFNSTISGNTAITGGGVYLYDNGSPALITDSIISGNHATANGGGIYFYGPNYDVTIQRTTISGNTADGKGGGIYFYDTDGGAVLIDSSTISGNTAGTNGGGIYFYNVDDPVTIVNSTISGNSAGDAGGGIYFYGVSEGATISFSTIANNSALYGGNLVNNGNAVTIGNSIIADGTAPTDPDLAGGEYTINYSLIETPGDAAFSGTGNITGVDPQLGPLQNNGGPTQTQLPAPTSPVIDAGDPAFVKPPAFDQRGQDRLSGTRVDMGAVEVQGGLIQFSSATYTVAENGGSVTISISRTGGTDPATVQFTTSNGTATAGADYTATSGTITFAAGQTTATAVVPILDDTVVEGNETFNVTLSSPSGGATLGAQSTAVVTITDFEEGHLQFSSATTSGLEGSSVTITVTRSGGSDGAVSAHYQTSNGTATAGADYTATSGTVSFAAGDTAPKSFSIPLLSDALPEGNETFNVNLSAPTGGATIGSPSTEVVTIVDFAPGTVQFGNAAYTVAESDGTVTITVQRTGGTDGPLTVHYATSNGTATAPSDYAASSGTVTFAAGDATPQTIVIPIVSDAIPEPPETFTVTLSTPSAGTIGPLGTTTVTITPPAAEIPTLGPIGKLLLALSTMASALVIMGRRRIFGFLFAAMMIGALTHPLFAATAVKPVKPVAHAKFGGHNPHNLGKVKVTGTIAEVTNGKNVTVTLTNGLSVSIPNTQISVSMNGTTSSVNALAQGQKVTIVRMTDPKGNLMRVKIKVKDKN